MIILSQCLTYSELVHACQQELNPEEREETDWFAEALATALAKQHSVIPIACTYEDLLYHFENIDGLYETFFTIGAYMLEQTGHETILTYIKQPETLLRDGEKLFAAAVAWSVERTESLR